jgi:hypothetical protein
VIWKPAALAIALSGCASWNNYHPIAEFPPTPNVETAWHTCHDEVNYEFLPENMAWSALGPVGQVTAALQPSPPQQRMTRAMQRCMQDHGWARNPE